MLQYVKSFFSSAGPSSKPKEKHTPTTLSCGPHGNLKGLLISALDDKPKCRRFCQIPYAEPPVGELRWKRPVPLPEDVSWEGVEGDKFGKIGYQPNYEFQWPTGPTSTTPPDMVQSEDCLTLNVWVPASTPPPGGFPVVVWIHGGWLQIGNAYSVEPSDMISPEDLGMDVIIVTVGYRLGVYGFLASKEIQAENDDGLAGNFGFHDQRLALEFVSKNIHHFAGEPTNITIMGLSAGSYSVHFQLCHEFNFPEVPSLIKRAHMISNAISSQPKTVEESQEGFDGLCEAFGVDGELSGEKKMKKLRGLSGVELRDMVMKLKIHTFRAVTDDVFVHSETMTRLNDGRFAKEFNKRGLSLIIGEVDQEERMYSCTNPPKDLADLEVQLRNYYNPPLVKRLLDVYGFSSEEVEKNKIDMAKLKAMFGEMTADLQVYLPERMLVKSIYEDQKAKWSESYAAVESAADAVKPFDGMERVLRYRINWVTEQKAKAAYWPGAITHSEDLWMWWYDRNLIAEGDVPLAKEWLAPVKAFYHGDIAKATGLWWGESGLPSKPDTMRYLKDGKAVVADDVRWAGIMEIGEKLRQEQKE